MVNSPLIRPYLLGGGGIGGGTLDSHDKIFLLEKYECDQCDHDILLMAEIRRSPVEVGSFSHYL